MRKGAIVFSELADRLPPAPGARSPSQFRRLVEQGTPIVSFAQAFLGKVVDMSESNVRTKQASGVNRGFTLIELMIAVAIVAIIAMIAIPSYTAQIVKGRRSAAEAFLMDIAQREQQYLLDVRGYAYSVATLYSVATPNTTIPVDVSAYYTVTIDPPPLPPVVPPTFTASAVPL